MGYLFLDPYPHTTHNNQFQMDTELKVEGKPIKEMYFHDH